MGKLKINVKRSIPSNDVILDSIIGYDFFMDTDVFIIEQKKIERLYSYNLFSRIIYIWSKHN